VPTPYKSCRKCRAKATIQNNDPTVKARKKILKPTYKKVTDAYNHRPDVKAGRKAYIKSDLGKAAAARSAKKRRTDPGKNLGDRIRHGLVRILNGSTTGSRVVFKYTQFKSGAVVRRHFERQFGTSGMSWRNYGWGSDKWNVGHRIARAQYDESNAADFRRCWSKKNLFPQWQNENMLLGTKLPSSEVLAELSDVHPIAWSVSR
tara:strand:+ start:981 stop:1592 length:612 start_codon:yes stop_codon:yes gene_type:complete